MVKSCVCEKNEVDLNEILSEVIFMTLSPLFNHLCLTFHITTQLIVGRIMKKPEQRRSISFRTKHQNQNYMGGNELLEED